ncbi:LPS translocon maturation chaperone LptM [Sulfurivirga caldicuralii]|nr:lipoprotein [Sulfurivirga caldicuralii]
MRKLGHKVVILAALALLLGACGKKGPLKLPPEVPKQMSQMQ